MSQTLTLELSEQTFAAIQQQALENGVAPALLAAALIEQRFIKKTILSPGTVDLETAKEEFALHFGTLITEGEVSIDNDDIDADLVREYADNHE